jgi:hypothetical protein
VAGKRRVFKGWTVLNKEGQVQCYQFGHLMDEVVQLTKKQAFERARLLAEREDEITSGDINRWEFGKMQHAEVRRRGYRVVRAFVMVRD